LNSIRAIIVDDEPLARERLRSMLETEPDIEIIDECADGVTAVESIETHRPDLVFLDVNMPELDGIGVLERIGTSVIPAVIFVTAYDHFAVQAFDAHAVDYVLKPFDEDRFRTAVQRARSTLKARASDEIDSRLAALLSDMKRPRHLERLAIKAGGKIVFIRTEEIDWIGAEGNYARIHTGNRSHLLRETMNTLETKLDPERFLRIHRSTIVNTESIAELEPLFQGDYVVILRDGSRLTSSRGYRQNLQAFMNRAS
jgi:two-component system, LytTR family, response regulator